MALDYSRFAPQVNPLQSAMQAVQLGQGLQSLEAGKQKAELIRQQQARIREMQADLNMLAGNESATADDYRGIITKYPDLAQHFKATIDKMDADTKKNTIRQAMNIDAAINSGQLDIAENLLMEQKEAAENSGDKEGADSAEILLQTMKLNPKSVSTTARLMLVNSLGEKPFAEYLENQQKQRPISADMPGLPQEERYVQRVAAQYKEDTGEEMPKGLRAKAQLEHKRAQANEVRETTLAKGLATAQNAEAIAYNTKMGRALAEIRTARAIAKAAGKQIPVEQEAKARSRMTDNLEKLANYYAKLGRLGGMVDVENNTMQNIWAKVKSTKGAQIIQRAMGTDEQSVRNAIDSIRPLLLQDIRQATSMSARGLDSEKELEFYMKAATDLGADLQANTASILLLDRAYGEGQLYESLEPGLSKATKDFLDKSLKEGVAIRNGRDLSPEERIKAIEKMNAAREELRAKKPEELANKNRYPDLEQTILTPAEELASITGADSPAPAPAPTPTGQSAQPSYMRFATGAE